MPGSSVMQLLGRPADLELGRRRARAALLLTLGLPGGAYVYQGEELGLEEVEDLPEERARRPDLGALGSHRPGPRRLPRADPVVGHPAAVRVQPGGRARGALAAAAGRLGRPDRRGQTGDPGSMLELYRTALHLRRGVAARSATAS